MIPRTTQSQICKSTKITIDPKPNDFRERVDFFGNRVIHFSIHFPHKELAVSSVSDIQANANSTDFTLSKKYSWEMVANLLQESTELDVLEARQFVLDSPKIAVFPDIVEYANPSFPRDRPIRDSIRNLLGRIHSDFDFEPGFTDISTPLKKVLKHRKGVCQDFAHLAIACFRAKGLAARYVSGFIETLPPPGKERMVGADASHAWCSVFVPKYGWIDVDPTNNMLANHQHITVAWGRDFSDVSPLKGVVYGGGRHMLTVSVDVQRIEGDQKKVH